MREGEEEIAKRNRGGISAVISGGRLELGRTQLGEFERAGGRRMIESSLEVLVLTASA